MSPLLLVALGGLVVLAIVWGPRLAARLSGRGQAGAGLLVAAILLAVLRQPALAAPVGLLALTLLRGAVAQGRPIPTAGGRSEVRSDALAMWLDHDSGEMGGDVLSGRFAGRTLETLDAAELQDLARELEDDPDSLGLLLAYLDRRRGETDGPDAPGDAPETGREMTPAEALRILGLPPGATAQEVRAAHRRLIKRVHPDLGGSDALAAMINAAKARLDP
jgi:hypothetical protein